MHQEFETSASWNLLSLNPKPASATEDLHPTLPDKAAALGFYLVQNHPFIDGNKRVGHAAMETFLVLNGQEIDASVDEQERLMLAIASGAIDRPRLAEWLGVHIKKIR